jgi:hypothetical protein
VTLKAFLFLFVVTIVAVVASATIAERLVDPGFERGIVIAVLSSLVVFPAARWAEYRGWIKGAWSPGGDLRTAQEARREREAREAAESRRAEAAPPDRDGDGSRQPPAGPPEAGATADSARAGHPSSPGDPR